MAYRLPLIVMSLILMAADRPSLAEREANQQKLADWQSYVGQWRGVGQPERGSQKGAWTEKADWAWHFDESGAAIEFTAPDSPHYVRGLITTGKQPETFVLTAERPDGQKDVFRGSIDEQGNWTFAIDDANGASSSAVAQITLRQVAEGKRMIVLLEKRASPMRLVRVAEIGYTREGSGFAAGATGPECIVTGGAGTIAVSYEGKTYYVCCTGCKQLFDEDPAGVIADYQARQAAKRSD